ncbi:MAG: TVP38/TMEM64 family protein [Acidobacteria bacterium]|nr:TVP38/TMEM64 family protein [Acidobacteriota bacterium]
MTILLGSIYGIAVGFLVAMGGSVAGAAAVFVLGQTVLRSWARRRMAGWARVEAIARAVGDRKGWIALLLRLSPVVPFNLINYAFSVTELPLGVYLLTTAIGIVPATVMYLYVGAATAMIVTGAEETNFQLALYAVGLVATLLAVWLIGRAVKTALRDAAGGRPS